VFGITALPMQTLEALVALGRFIPVLMFVHNPSCEHWGHLTENLIPEGHPLLAAWGKHGRNYLHAIDNFEAADPNAAPFEPINGVKHKHHEERLAAKNKTSNKANVSKGVWRLHMSATGKDARRLRMEIADKKRALEDEKKLEAEHKAKRRTC
jgi:hypothetical protein